MSLVFHATDALYSHWCRRELWPRPLIISCFFFFANHSSVDDFIDCGLLVPGASDDELVVRGDITAENRRRLLRLNRQRGSHISYKQLMNHVFVQIVTQKFKYYSSQN